MGNWSLTGVGLLISSLPVILDKRLAKPDHVHHPQRWINIKMLSHRVYVQTNLNQITKLSNIADIVEEFEAWSFLGSNLVNQRGNVEKRDVGDSAGVNSKLDDMQNAIESLTHSVNTVATKQQVRMHIFSNQQLRKHILRFSFTRTAVC